jgi:D-proline reductase (dithiol) PrdB
MPVDSFKFLPRIIAAFYQATERKPEFPIPWTPLPGPLNELKFGLVTSGGLHHRGHEPPFDVKREIEEPTWGDPTFRTIPADIQPDEVGVSHLHLNPKDILEDFNILLPLQRFQELVAEGRIGALAQKAYSFMGFQGFPPEANEWQQRYGPQVAERFLTEGVACVLLTPA